MVERYRPGVVAEGALPATAGGTSPSVYFGSEGKDLLFLDTGCTLLNCVIGGGWPLGRVVNIVGDRSTGKTLLAEEAMANFQRQHSNGNLFYRETEAAFDVSYAKALGLDTDKVDFGSDGPDTQWATIEDFVEDLTVRLDDFDLAIVNRAKALEKKQKKSTPSQALMDRAVKEAPPNLYILDSLDALSSTSELARDIRQGSYNLEKPKLLGEFFRKETRRLRRTKTGLIVISQIRDRIGAMIRGKKYTRSGGKALDFYASIVLYLSEIGKVKRTVKGVERPVAVKIRAKCEKNKISMPFRECEFEIVFGYGIDDDWASLDWLKSVKRLDEVGLKDLPSSLKNVDVKKLKSVIIPKVWYDIEKGFTPEKGKYAE